MVEFITFAITHLKYRLKQVNEIFLKLVSLKFTFMKMRSVPYFLLYDSTMRDRWEGGHWWGSFVYNKKSVNSFELLLILWLYGIFIAIGRVNIGIIIYVLEIPNHDYTTLSRILIGSSKLSGWLIYENNEKATLNINMPYSIDEKLKKEISLKMWFVSFIVTARSLCYLIQSNIYMFMY